MATQSRSEMSQNLTVPSADPDTNNSDTGFKSIELTLADEGGRRRRQGRVRQGQTETCVAIATGDTHIQIEGRRWECNTKHVRIGMSLVIVDVRVVKQGEIAKTPIATAVHDGIRMVHPLHDICTKLLAKNFLLTSESGRTESMRVRKGHRKARSVKVSQLALRGGYQLAVGKKPKTLQCGMRQRTCVLAIAHVVDRKSTNTRSDQMRTSFIVVDAADRKCLIET